jgi:hypothetical protein
VTGAELIVVREIVFIPPDGGFELMNYRKTGGIAIPFTVTPLVSDLPGNRKEIRVDMRSNYAATLSAKPVIIMIPCPDNTADVDVTATSGKANYFRELGAVAWKIAAFPGRAQAEVVVVVTCVKGMTNAPMRLTAPIAVEFSIPMLAASDMDMKYLTIVEKSGYTSREVDSVCHQVRVVRSSNGFNQGSLQRVVRLRGSRCLDRRSSLGCQVTARNAKRNYSRVLSKTYTGKAMSLGA